MNRAVCLVCAALACMVPGLTHAQTAGRPATHATLGGPLALGLEAARTSDYPAAEKALLTVQGADRPTSLIAVARVMLEQGRFADAHRYATHPPATPHHRL